MPHVKEFIKGFKLASKARSVGWKMTVDEKSKETETGVHYYDYKIYLTFSPSSKNPGSKDDLKSAIAEATVNIHPRVETHWGNMYACTISKITYKNSGKNLLATVTGSSHRINW